MNLWRRRQLLLAILGGTDREPEPEPAGEPDATVQLDQGEKTDD